MVSSEAQLYHDFLPELVTLKKEHDSVNMDTGFGEAMDWQNFPGFTFPGNVSVWKKDIVSFKNRQFKFCMESKVFQSFVLENFRSSIAVI